MQQTQTPSTAPEDDFVNLADLIRIIWRRRCAILTVTLLSALVTATYVLLKPRPYTAVAMMEVVPEYSREGQVDKGFFETRVLTHLEIARSTVLGMQVLKICDSQGIKLDFSELQQSMKVIRLPKTSIIQGSIILPRSENALTIVRIWRDETMREVQRKAMEKALIYVRGRLKEMQEDWLKNTTVAKVARENAEQLEDQKLITVARSVDGAVLWQDMVQIPNSNSLDRMRDLQLKSQEINQEYLYMRTRLAEAEQNAAGAITSREFYVRVVDEISKRLQSFNGDATPTATAEAPDELTAQAQDYVNTVLNSAEVLPLGTPVVYSSSRGVIKKTILAGGSVFFIACFVALVCEWFRRVGLE